MLEMTWLGFHLGRSVGSSSTSCVGILRPRVGVSVGPCR